MKEVIKSVEEVKFKRWYLPGGVNSVGSFPNAWVDNNLPVGVTDALGLGDVDWDVIGATFLSSPCLGNWLFLIFKWAIEPWFWLLYDGAGIIRSGVGGLFLGGVFYLCVW